MSSDGTESIEQHLQRWRDRLQESIDESSSTDAQAVHAHLQTCEHCKVEQRRLRRIDAHLRAELPIRPVPSAGFDARLMARIDELAADARANARTRELRDHYSRLDRLQHSWRGYWRFNLGNVLGVVAVLIASFLTLASTAASWSSRTLQAVHGLDYRSLFDWSSLSVFAICAAGVIALSTWLFNAGERRFN